MFITLITKLLKILKILIMEWLQGLLSYILQMVLVVGKRDVSITQINALSGAIFRLNSYTNQFLV
jgi:hypothetical protein